MIKNLLIIFLGCMGCWNSLAQEMSDQQGEVEDAQVLIEKDKIIKLPPADRQYEEMAPMQTPPSPLPLSYSFPDYPYQVSNLDPRIRMLGIKNVPLKKTRSNYLKFGYGNFNSPYLEGYLDRATVDPAPVPLLKAVETPAEKPQNDGPPKARTDVERAKDAAKLDTTASHKTPVSTQKSEARSVEKTKQEPEPKAKPVEKTKQETEPKAKPVEKTKQETEPKAERAGADAAKPDEKKADKPAGRLLPWARRAGSAPVQIRHGCTLASSGKSSPRIVSPTALRRSQKPRQASPLISFAASTLPLCQGGPSLTRSSRGRQSERGTRKGSVAAPYADRASATLQVCSQDLRIRVVAPLGRGKHAALPA